MLKFLVPRPRVPSLRSQGTLPLRQFSTSQPSSSTVQAQHDASSRPKTHFKITLRRSAIALPEVKKATLVALGLHRRLQTVFHRHTPEAAGKILAVKELVAVENVGEEEVMDKTEMRRRRKAPPGFGVLNEMKGEQRFGML